MSRARAARRMLPARPLGQYTSMLDVRRADPAIRKGAGPAEHRGGAAAKVSFIGKCSTASDGNAVHLRGVAAEHLHFLALRQPRHGFVHVVDRIEAHRMGKVGLEHHVIHAH